MLRNIFQTIYFSFFHKRNHLLISNIYFNLLTLISFFTIFIVIDNWILYQLI